MTDHANELRRYSRKIGRPAGDVPSVMLAAAEEIERLAARLEATEEDRSNFLVEMGKLCAQCDALRLRIKAAEKERDDVAQQLVQSEISKREISEAHDAMQIEVGKLKDLEVSRCVKINGYIVDNARLAEEVERLRAKVAEMEQQEPVRLVTAVAYRWRYRGAVMWQYGELTEETARLAKEHNHEVQPLGILPGAKGEEK